MKRPLELLSPAKNADIAIQAILHGADAVYMGATSHGARQAASNSLDDIEKVVDFARQYRAKVYVTVNTVIYDDEIPAVESLCRDLYHIGADALIVQDMAFLRMKIPPIALHASTQCDIRTPQKAKFLQEVGMSQLVLARELTINEIRAIADEVTIPIETFIHGALCVCYSGRCHASLAVTGRSANRGECAQICRFPYILEDAEGKILAKDKYLLSLKDLNTSNNLEKLIKAGVSSFKIEGRLKDMGYVKNVTAFYHNQLNEIIGRHPSEFVRSSFGDVSFNFDPNPEKSFNRRFTDYFQTERNPLRITSMYTPKSQGEAIYKISDLHNGDGIGYLDKDGKFKGVRVNRVEGNQFFTAGNVTIPKKVELRRTSDIQWNKIIESDTALRKIPVSIKMSSNGVEIRDTRGCLAKISMPPTDEIAKKDPNYQRIFKKLGDTPYKLENFEITGNGIPFYPASLLAQKRRELIDLLDFANKTTYTYSYRRLENKGFPYPAKEVDYKENVANQLSTKFYLSHGVKKIEPAAEVSGNIKQSGKTLMTTRYCMLRELGMCKKEKNNKGNIKFPLSLRYEKGSFRLDFDCKNCEMKVLYDKK